MQTRKKGEYSIDTQKDNKLYGTIDTDLKEEQHFQLSTTAAEMPYKLNLSKSISPPRPLKNSCKIEVTIEKIEDE